MYASRMGFWRFPASAGSMSRRYDTIPGDEQKAGTDDTIPAVMPDEMSSKESRQKWARMIQKIYEVDPLVCPKCRGAMRIN